MEEKEVNQMNMLSLAFLGDAVFTLFVRERLLNSNDGKSGALHKKASAIVCASAQAKMLDGITDEMTETEKDIARRSRNCHNNTKAKNATLATYKKATALEGVLGYLWESGQKARAYELMNKCMEIISSGGKDNE